MDPFVNNRKELVKPKEKQAAPMLPLTEEELGGKIMEQLPKGTELTVEQKGVLNKYMDGMRWSITGVSPLTCKDAECHPAGTPILTLKGYKNIEDLSKNDQLVAWSRNGQYIRPKGYNFSLYSRQYSGSLISMYAGKNSHLSTPEHYCIARWSEKSHSKFAVYLMKKGDFFRVGKCKLFGNNGTFGPGLRANAEHADKLWILDICDTNVEALLKEEYYSLLGGISKSLFIASEKFKRSKDNGLYKWVTQDQLDNHHKSILRNDYSEFFKKVKLREDLPIWEKHKDTWDKINESRNLGQYRILILNAQNLLPEIMEVPIYPENPTPTKRGFKSDWSLITNKTEKSYDGLVYSLNVDVHKTYITNNIVTHNCPYYSKCPLVKAEIPRPIGEDCPVEKGLMLQWLEQYIATSGMDLERLSAYDMLILQDIAYQQLLEARAAMELADNPLIQVKTFVGVDHRDGSPMYTYSLNNLVTFRERSNKIKMKLLREIIATAKSKSEEERGQSDKSTEIALKLREIEKKLGKSGIKMPQVIDIQPKE